MQVLGISEMFPSRNAEMPHTGWGDQYKDAPEEARPYDEPIECDTRYDSECQLTEQAKKGDRQAMNELLRGARKICMAVALRVLHHVDTAQDVAQDACVKVWKNLSTFEGRSSFSSWVYRIAMNTCFDSMRRMSVQPRVANSFGLEKQSGSSESLMVTESPEDLLIAKQQSEQVHHAVEALPLTHREVIKYREFDELSYDDMAGILGCPIGTVMSRIHYARKCLAASLNDDASDCPGRFFA